MVNKILESIKPLEQQLAGHKIYAELKSLEELKVFMSYHVYCVWDFMNLVKNLQNSFAPIGSVWVPPTNPLLARFINEIVLGEESDQLPSGEAKSHFEIYIKAMEEIGASTNEMQNFIQNISSSQNGSPLLPVNIPRSVREFMIDTLDIISRGEAHLVAAYFAFGREQVIPRIFTQIIERSALSQSDAPLFYFYLQRHIELDDEEHGPLALKMVEFLCGDDQEKWNQVLLAAESSIKARIKLWDALYIEIKKVDEQSTRI